MRKILPGPGAVVKSPGLRYILWKTAAQVVLSTLVVFIVLTLSVMHGDAHFDWLAS